MGPQTKKATVSDKFAVNYCSIPYLACCEMCVRQIGKRVLLLFGTYLMLIACIETAKYNRYGGPFDVIAKYPFECEDVGTNEISFKNVRAQKKSRTEVVFSGTVSSLRDFSDNFTLIVNFAAWGNGGWRPNFVVLDLPKACTGFSELVPAIFKAFSIYNVTSCPMPAGNYHVEDVTANINFTFVNFPYNKYRVYVNIKEKGVLLGCFGLHVDIVPKGSNRGKK